MSLARPGPMYKELFLKRLMNPTIHWIIEDRIIGACGKLFYSNFQWRLDKIYMIKIQFNIDKYILPMAKLIFLSILNNLHMLKCNKLVVVCYVNEYCNLQNYHEVWWLNNFWIIYLPISMGLSICKSKHIYVSTYLSLYLSS
jgi:hypothetical protein